MLTVMKGLLMNASHATSSHRFRVYKEARERKRVTIRTGGNQGINEVLHRTAACARKSSFSRPMCSVRAKPDL